METAKNSPNYKKLPSEDLLSIMAQTGTDRPMAEKAFAEFHRRYVHYVFRICINNCMVKGITDQEERASIAHNTLLSVFKGAKSFIRAGAGKDEKEKERRVKAWMGKIASKELLAYLRKYGHKDEPVMYIDNYAEMEDTYLEVEEEPPPPSEERVLLEKALRSLPEKDRDIMMTYLAHENDQGKIDPKIHEKLCSKHNVLPGNLRKIKTRAILKLKTLIVKNPNQENYETESKKSRRGRRQIQQEVDSLLTVNGPDVSRYTGTG
jgi:DNA-directed RNA polymerase specialized sigma24 family protein